MDTKLNHGYSVGDKVQLYLGNRHLKRLIGPNAAIIKEVNSAQRFYLKFVDGSSNWFSTVDFTFLDDKEYRIRKGKSNLKYGDFVSINKFPLIKAKVIGAKHSKNEPTQYRLYPDLGKRWYKGSELVKVDKFLMKEPISLLDKEKLPANFDTPLDFTKLKFQPLPYKDKKECAVKKGCCVPNKETFDLTTKLISKDRKDMESLRSMARGVVYTENSIRNEKLKKELQAVTENNIAEIAAIREGVEFNKKREKLDIVKTCYLILAVSSTLMLLFF